MNIGYFGSSPTGHMHHYVMIYERPRIPASPRKLATSPVPCVYKGEYLIQYGYQSKDNLMIYNVSF